MLDKILKTQPALFISLIAAILGLAVSYGLLTQTHADAYIALLPAIVSIVQGLLIKQAVFAPATVQAIANAATTLPPGTPVDIGNPPAGPVPPAPPVP